MPFAWAAAALACVVTNQQKLADETGPPTIDGTCEEVPLQDLLSHDDGCCHRTRLRGASCPLGHTCPFE